MSGFSVEWLALREPYDRAARNADVLAAAIATVGTHAHVRMVDLACGAGSTMRTLAPLVPGGQSWRLVDNDLSLLARAATPPLPANVTATPMPLDLVRDVEAALDGPVDLVATSALLDLVSDEWLERLSIELAARRLPFYAALSYDGRVTFDPVDPFDDKIVEAVNRHQRNDKGFGPALGPDAADAALGRFRALGYAVAHGHSDWLFEPGDASIQDAVVAGWAQAATEVMRRRRGDVAAWLERRRTAIGRGASTIRVGHVDFLARFEPA